MILVASSISWRIGSSSSTVKIVECSASRASSSSSTGHSSLSPELRPEADDPSVLAVTAAAVAANQSAVLPPATAGQLLDVQPKDRSHLQTATPSASATGIHQRRSLIQPHRTHLEDDGGRQWWAPRMYSFEVCLCILSRFAFTSLNDELLGLTLFRRGPTVILLHVDETRGRGR